MDNIPREIQQTDGEEIADENVDSLSKLLDKNVSRRTFLKNLSLAAGSVALASCAPKKTFSLETENTFLDENVKELNRQFSNEREKHLNSDWTFNYERYSKTYPEFTQYIQHIETHASDIYKQYGIDSNISKALSSSIICSQLGNWEKIDTSKDLLNQRIGPMQFYPSNVLPVIEKHFNMTISIDEAKLDQNNIYFGMISLAESLKKIENNGENTDLMTLMLADYYGGSSLVGLIKNNQEIDDNHYLKSNYNLYKKNLNILNETPPENLETVEMDPQVKEIWNKAIKLWPHTKFKFHQADYQKQIETYTGSFDLSDLELLSLFLSVALVESQGGNEKKNTSSGAIGWYQIIPAAGHIKDYNDTHPGKNYTAYDIENNDSISIEVGVWPLMRYRYNLDLEWNFKFFKGGGHWEGPEGSEELVFDFGKHDDDALWWNRVSYCSQQLFGYDRFNMGYIDYIYDNKRYNADYFLQNSNHIHPLLKVKDSP